MMTKVWVVAELRLLIPGRNQIGETAETWWLLRAQCLIQLQLDAPGMMGQSGGSTWYRPWTCMVPRKSLASACCETDSEIGAFSAGGGGSGGRLEEPRRKDRWGSRGVGGRGEYSVLKELITIFFVNVFLMERSNRTSLLSPACRPGKVNLREPQFRPVKRGPGLARIAKWKSR